VTRAQSRLLHTLLGKLTVTSRDDKLRALSHLTSRDIASSNDLTGEEARNVIDHLQAVGGWPEGERTAEVDILTRPANDPWAVAS
jgi:hypothetical protein